MTTYITTTESQGYLRWHIQRPERMNALGTTLANEFALLVKDCKKRLQKIGKNPPLRGLILSAETVRKAQGSFWIAGGDLKELALLKTAASIKAYTKSFQGLAHFFETVPIPVVALIDGLAIGGGAELALGADIRVGDANCGFQFKQLSVGLATGYGGAKRLVDIVGRGKAQQYLYSGGIVTAAEAHYAGLLTHQASDLTLGLESVQQFLDHVDLNAFAAQKSMLLSATRGEQTSFYTKEEALFLKLWGNDTHKRTIKKFND